MPYRRKGSYRRAKGRYHKKYVRRTAGIATYMKHFMPPKGINWTDWAKMKGANTVTNAAIGAWIYPMLKTGLHAWAKGNHWI
jgi:hypothetical protein